MITPLLALALLAPAADLPPSPAEVPGVKIWPAPAFSHWPAVIHPDEERHVVLQVPVRVAGGRAEYRWLGTAGSIPLPVADGWRAGKEPPGTPVTGILLVLPTNPGMADAEFEGQRVPLQVVAADQPWPAARLVEGRAVDAEGRPVVLVDARHDATAERRFALLADGGVRPEGSAVILGDDLAGALRDLPNLRSQWVRGPSAAAAGVVAAAAALAALPAPATLCWSPGTTAFRRPDEEDRVLGAIAHRCRALGIAPRLVLLLPTLPPDVPEAGPRREALAQAAAARGWRVVTVDRLAGADAARVAPGVEAAGPVGAGRERLRQALADLLTSR